MLDIKIGLYNFTTYSDSSASVGIDNFSRRFTHLAIVSSVIESNTFITVALLSLLMDVESPLRACNRSSSLESPAARNIITRLLQ